MKRICCQKERVPSSTVRIQLNKLRDKLLRKVGKVRIWKGFRSEEPIHSRSSL